MRGTLPLWLAAFAVLGATAASADVQTYCEAFARSETKAHLAGGAILGGATVPPPEEEREARHNKALADCLALYVEEAKPEPRKAAPRKAAKKPRSTGLKVGSQAWKDYCARKYASFDPLTGSYRSYNGKYRPCR